MAYAEGAEGSGVTGTISIILYIFSVAKLSNRNIWCHLHTIPLCIFFKFQHTVHKSCAKSPALEIELDTFSSIWDNLTI